MIEPLYSADEMRAAEALYPGHPDTAPELMELAAAAVAEHLVRRHPDARRITAVCGGGANGGGSVHARPRSDNHPHERLLRRHAATTQGDQPR